MSVSFSHANRKSSETVKIKLRSVRSVSCYTLGAAAVPWFGAGHVIGFRWLALQSWIRWWGCSSLCRDTHMISQVHKNTSSGWRRMWNIILQWTICTERSVDISQGFCKQTISSAASGSSAKFKTALWPVRKRNRKWDIFEGAAVCIFDWNVVAIILFLGFWKEQGRRTFYEGLKSLFLYTPQHQIIALYHQSVLCTHMLIHKQYIRPIFAFI